MPIFNDGRTKNSSKFRFVVVAQVYTLSEQTTDTTAKFQTAAKVSRISRNICQEQVFLVLVTTTQGGNNYLTPRAKAANWALAMQDLYQSSHTCPHRPHAPRRGLSLLLDKRIPIHCEGDKQKTLHNNGEVDWDCIKRLMLCSFFLFAAEKNNILITYCKSTT